MLVSVGLRGRLSVKMLKRSAIMLFENRIGAGPPLESPRLTIEKPSRFYLEQMNRAQKEAISIYNKSQKDLQLLKLYVLRADNKLQKDDSYIPNSVNLDASVKIDIQVLQMLRPSNSFKDRWKWSTVRHHLSYT